MNTFLQLVASGVLTGGVYALLGLAIVLVYKSTRVFNISQGGLVMVGAYANYFFIASLKFPLWLGILGALAFAVLLGLAIERFVMRPLIGQPLLAPIMITLALMAFLNSGTIAIFGADPRVMPDVLPRNMMDWGGVKVSELFSLSFIAVVVFLLSFAAFFRYSKWGLAMRVTAESHLIARSLGISVQSVFGIAWVIAAIIGAVTGLFLGASQGLSEYLPLIGLKAFAVVLVGGLESIPGAVIGGLLVGLIEALATGYLTPIIGPGVGDLSPWVILLLVLLFKPYGLFGLRRIERI